MVNQVDDADVNLGKEEGHGPAHMKRVGSEIIGEEANCRTEGKFGDAECNGDIHWHDGVAAGASTALQW